MVRDDRITEKQDKVQTTYFHESNSRQSNGNKTGNNVGKRVGDAIGDAIDKGTPLVRRQRIDQLRADNVSVACISKCEGCTFTLPGTVALYAENWRSHLLSSAACAEAVREGLTSRTGNFKKANKHLVEVWTKTATGKKWLERKASLAWRVAGQPTEFSVKPGNFR